MRKLFTILVVLSLSLTASAAMKAQWSMDDGAGLTVIDSVAGNNGTINGAVSWNGVGAAPSPADSLNFAGGGVVVPDAPELNVGSGSFTLSWYMKSDVTGQFLSILDKGDNMRYEVYTYGGEFYAELDAHDGTAGRDGKTDLIIPEAPFFTGEWVHGMIVVDRTPEFLKPYGTLSIYADGELLSSTMMNTDGSLDEAGTPFNIGSAWGAPFMGDLDHITLYDHAVPEPATMTLLGLGLVGLLRRKRS